MGGYDDGGTPTAWQSDGQRLWLTLFVYLPYLTLVPLGWGGWQRWLLVALSSSLLVVILWRIRIGQWRRFLVALALTLLPALPVLGLDADRLGARFFYWPLAVAFALAGSVLPPPTRLQRAAWAGLSLFWMAASIANGRPWSRAGEEVARTTAAMRGAQPTMDTGVVVMVDARDSVGAYVFRNGLPEAAEVLGLRRDVEWRRGTAANLSGGEIPGLGEQIRVLGVQGVSLPRDLTACERSLYEAPDGLRTVWRAESAAHGVGPPSLTFRPGPVEDAAALFVALRSSSSTGEGLMQWRTPPTPFSMSRSRTFRPDGKAVTFVRIEPDTAREAELRVILPAGASLSELRLIDAGPACRRDAGQRL